MQIGIGMVEAPKGVPKVVSVVTPGFLAEYARYAEELGYDFIVFSEHVVIPMEYTSRYPYQGYESDGEFRRYPYEDTAFPDPLISLAWAATSTSRLRLRTNVLLLPQRNPVVLAKELATLDALSGGRVEIGVGIGWLREEMEAVGVPWARRGQRTEEYIEAMRALWTEQEATYQGEFVSFTRVRSLPKPVQPGGIKIIVGGHSKAAALRAARLGDGFAPTGPPGTDRKRFIQMLRRAAEQVGRDPDSIPIYSGAPPEVDAIKQAEAEGIASVSLGLLGATLEESKARLRETAERLFPHFK